MRTSAVAGIVFANAGDNLLKRLTSNRSVASVPFGARYRLIDFSLSNLVNAGITSVGIITKENYRSLMDHVGNGVHWELDRKNGGLYLLPPYLTSGVKKYAGTVDALYGAKDFITRCKSEYFVICHANVLANINISAAVEEHISKEADITIIYKQGEVGTENSDNLSLKLDKDNKVTAIDFNLDAGTKTAYGLGVTIINRNCLLDLTEKAYEEDLKNFSRDVLVSKVNQLKIYGFEHKEYAAFMKSTDSYYKACMDLLDVSVRRQLFNPKRPIYTKTRDDMPTKYGTKADVKNSLIADGCIINGTVKNSILFRGVKVEKGAVVENSILMQETFVSEGAQLSNVVSDKDSVVGKDMVLKGTNEEHFFIQKNETV